MQALCGGGQQATAPRLQRRSTCSAASCRVAACGPQLHSSRRTPLTDSLRRSAIGFRCRRYNAGVVRAAAAEELVDPDPSFRIEKVSFGTILTPLGLGMLVYGFGGFFQLLPGGDISSLLLIYGFVISLLGFALSYAQLKPVPCKTTAEAFALRDSQCTDIQKQVREDVTRYRYGDEQHLDEALDRVFRFNKPKGVPRRFTPILKGVREEAVDGAYTLVLEFAKRKEMPLEDFTSRQDKFQSFFGPGVTADMRETDQGVDVYLKSDGSGAGRGGGEQKDVLPPLMPGLPGRRQE